MENLLNVHNQLVGSDDKNSWNELQGNCCSVTQVSRVWALWSLVLIEVFQAIIRKVEKAILPVADRIMTIVLGLLANSAKDAAVAEDAFMTISTLVIAIEQDFEKYVGHTMGYIQAALSTLDEFQVFTSAVGVTGDIARAIHKSIAPYCNDLLSALLAALASPVLHRTAKPTVVAVFGDIAIALGQDFTQYLDSVMGMLSQAGQVKADASSDLAMQDFVWAMRESITEAFTGILSGFRENREFTKCHRGENDSLSGCTKPHRSHPTSRAYSTLSPSPQPTKKYPTRTSAHASTCSAIWRPCMARRFRISCCSRR